MILTKKQAAAVFSIGYGDPEFMGMNISDDVDVDLEFGMIAVRSSAADEFYHSWDEFHVAYNLHDYED